MNVLSILFLETCSPVNILGHFRRTEIHTNFYISYNPFYVISTIKPYHTPYFIFTNNNNLPLLHAANENKLFEVLLIFVNKSSDDDV
jgi:hypothetical protein